MKTLHNYFRIYVLSFCLILSATYTYSQTTADIDGTVNADTLTIPMAGFLTSNASNYLLLDSESHMRLTSGVSGSLDPHIFLSSKDHFNIMTINGLSGRVGIGTSTPNEELQIIGGINVGNTTTSNAGTIRWTGSNFQGHDGVNWNSLTSPWMNSGANLYFDTGKVGLGTNSPIMDLHLASSSDLFLGMDASGNFSDAVIQMSNTGVASDNLVLRKYGPSSGGNLADGTPWSGSAMINSGSNASRFILGASGNKAMHLATDSNTRIFISPTGDIGVGTLVPSQKFHLKISGADGIRVEGDGTGDARGLFLSNGGGAHFIFDDNSDSNTFDIQSSNDLAFNTGGPNERMRIDDGGEVAINSTPATNSRLKVFTNDDLYGIFADQDGTSSAYAVYGNTASNGSQTKYGVNGVIGGSTGTGNSYGVRGSASTSASNFYAVYASGDLAYTGSMINASDRKLKRNINELESVLDKVMNLNAKTFEFKTDEYPYMNLAQGKQYGFIAQEVKEVFPTLVRESSHSFTSSDTAHSQEIKIDIATMKSMELIAILTRAIQEQQELIDSQQSQIDQLVTQNNEILARLTE